MLAVESLFSSYLLVLFLLQFRLSAATILDDLSLIVN